MEIKWYFRDSPLGISAGKRQHVYTQLVIPPSVRLVCWKCGDIWGSVEVEGALEWLVTLRLCDKCGPGCMAMFKSEWYPTPKTQEFISHELKAMYKLPSEEAYYMHLITGGK